MPGFGFSMGLGGVRATSATPTPTPTPAATATTILALNDRIAFEGDSITQGTAFPFTQAMVASLGGRLAFQGPTAYNAAHFGYTAATLAGSQYITETLATSPKVVSLLAGTNDLSSNDTPATIYAALKSMVKAYIDGGVELVEWATVLRRTLGTNGFTQDQETKRAALNAMIRSFATDSDFAAYQSKIVITDLENVYDPATDSMDGLHPGYTGAVKIGRARAATLSPYIATGSISDLLGSSTNLLGNPTFSGTGGQRGVSTTGDIADNTIVFANSYFDGSSTVAVAASKTTLNGAGAQKVVVSGGTSGNQSSVSIWMQGPNVTPAAGDRYEAFVYFRLESAKNMVDMGFETSVNSGSIAQPGSAPYSYPIDTDATGAYEGVMRGFMSQASDGSSGSTGALINFRMLFGNDVSEATLILSQPVLRKVPANQ